MIRSDSRYNNTGKIAYNQMRAAYTTHRRTFKWWKALFSFVLNVAMVDAFILFKAISLDNEGKTIQRKDLYLCIIFFFCRGYQREESDRERSLPFLSPCLCQFVIVLRLRHTCYAILFLEIKKTNSIT